MVSQGWWVLPETLLKVMACTMAILLQRSYFFLTSNGGATKLMGKQVSYDPHALAMQGSSPCTQNRVKVFLKEENLRPVNRLSSSSPTGEYLRPKALDGQTQRGGRSCDGCLPIVYD